MPEIVSRDAKLNVELLGARIPNVSLRPVVFVHGLVLDNLASFYFSVANAMSEFHDVVLYDLRGHGKSSRPSAGYTVSGMVDDLLAVVRGSCSAPVHLIGNSFGGVVALTFALKYPELVKSIVLIDAHLGDAGFADQMAATLSLQGAERDAQIAKSFEHWVGRHSERKRNRLAANARELIAGTSLVADVRATPPLAREDLARITVPVLALYGESSDLRERGERLLTGLANYRIEIFAGCTHAILWEATARLREEMALFLAEESSGS